MEADTWTEEIEALSGRCERKPGGCAIHWCRLALERIAHIRRLLFENWMTRGLHNSLVWHDFDGGIELRAPDRNKNCVVGQCQVFYAGSVAPPK